MASDDSDEFATKRRQTIERLGADEPLRERATGFLRDAADYSYNFDWLGLPIIQYPQDVVAIQELIWRISPRAIVETGIARGGSLALSASILELIGGDGIVIGVDIDIRDHNRRAIEGHRLSTRIVLIEGSSVDTAVVSRVHDAVGDREPVVVLLDSMHTHEHVLQELEAYSPLVGPGSYVVVFDTAIADMPAEFFSDRPWGPEDNPKTAVHQFLSENDRFEIDAHYDAKLLISAAPEGYLRCVK